MSSLLMGPRPNRIDAVLESERIREARVGGLRIAYRQAGSGPPLVLLHGGMDDSRSWRRQLDGLSDEFTVLAWDAPGCGRSSDVPESWRMADFADALAAWLDTLQLRRPHVLGLSGGSSLALEFYDRHSEIPASLILASAYAGWAGSLPAEEVADRLASVLAAADLTREELREGFASFLSSAAPPELLEELLDTAIESSAAAHPGGYRATAHSMAESDLRHVLPRIRIPTLLLYGELDQRSSPTVATALLAQIPTAQLHLIPGVGHLTHMEAPAEFNARVRQFLRTAVRS